MARRGVGGDGGSLFIGRLSRNTRVRDLEEIFESYGRMTRCDIKYGKCYAFDYCVIGFPLFHFLNPGRGFPSPSPVSYTHLTLPTNREV